jgi:hypothetical protein
MAKRHKDTTISLKPLTFEEAMRELAKTPKHKDSQAEEPGNTKEDALEFDPPKKRTAQA